MASDHNKSLEDQPKPSEAARKSGRPRKSKSTHDHHQPTQKQKKKQPQRGMGVEKLERLRLQERWKVMTEMNTFQNHHPFVSSSCFSQPTKINNVPGLFANFGGLGCGVGANGGGNFGLNQWFHGQYGSFETPKELSSKPNIKCSSDHCVFCLKKKLINGETLACNGVRDMYSEPSSINGCGFVSFNVGNNQDFRTKPAKSYAVNNADQSVEVVAVHRKGSSSSGEAVVMEYEFFPEKGGRSTFSSSSFSHNDLVMKMGSESSSVADVEGGEAYCVSNTTGVESSSSIDLSLKLYY